MRPCGGVMQEFANGEFVDHNISSYARERISKRSLYAMQASKQQTAE